MIGVLGGTFDPIHFGHLRPALEISEALALAQLRFVPNRIPPHRNAAHASAAARGAMVGLALAGEPGFALDERELQREGASYSVDTLAALRTEIGAATPLCFIMGVDAFLGFDRWHRWQRITELAHLVVSHRPGWALDAGRLSPALAALIDERRATAGAALHAAPAGRVLLQEVTQLDISATHIRALVAAGRSARYLVPERVYDYILEQRLYRQEA